MTYSRILPLAAALLCAGFGGVGVAQGASFSFNAVEFLPQDQREAAARAFVEQNVVKGMSMSSAVAALRRAGARCRTKDDGVVACTHLSFQNPPGEMLEDVSWEVRVYSAPTGAVDRASVTRTVIGD